MQLHNIVDPQQLKKTPNPNPRRRHKKSGLVATLFATFLFVAGLLLFFYRQPILDQVTVWRFTPSATLVSLADRAGLNGTGKFYLYASQAEVADRSEFNKKCGNLQNERTVVIGCYTGPDRRIYIYDVTDVSLDGVRETTAAHEMLHAAYDRLNPIDKKNVDDLLVKQEASITDARILNLIKEYQQSEPGQVVNELHSIFGTEVRSLSPELEAYYKRYFSNRSEVVALKEKYEKVFTDLAARQGALVTELNTLASEVNSKQNQYEVSLTALNADIESFNTWAQSGSATRSEYNSRRTTLQARIDALDAERTAINQDIDRYNAKKTELEKLNIRAASLNQSIDSKLSPGPTL